MHRSIKERQMWKKNYLKAFILVTCSSRNHIESSYAETYCRRAAISRVIWNPDVAGRVVIVVLCPSYELAKPLGGEPQALLRWNHWIVQALSHQVLNPWFITCDADSCRRVRELADGLRSLVATNLLLDVSYILWIEWNCMLMLSRK